MKLIVGLGNPDLKYKNTRHNAGFIALDYIKSNSISDFKFDNFIIDKSSKSKISKGSLNSEKVLLVKPQTYMNNSGFSVEKLISYYKLNPENDLIVVYDDIDLPIGNLKIKGKSSGGHKGMQSIIDVLKTNNIPRIRIGIQGVEKSKINDTSAYVLQNFNKLEKIELENSFKSIHSLIKELITK
jgi:PTH1 family peptidyl-tRNA hydrolase